MKKKKDIINDRGATEIEVKKEIGRKIKEMRNKLGQSALRIAQELKISREAITHIENGRNNVSAVVLWKLATLFNCDVHDFFPTVPDGYGITRVDLHKVEQESGKKAADWAKTLFGKEKKV
ncbi:MAG: helix-turn-helix transcriptional regulator [Candidatus Pacebacteria bacterium]|nr:helix-turn-helix transcriptional regulator [Candidatus Paceibacterota bacterium]MDD5356895.1 helix-turn-helix transcriptional regulator [Candidatus Paceibacterota bacterium]